jgi:site-specific recombinase XerD
MRCGAGTPPGPRRKRTRCSSACARRSAVPEPISAGAVGDIVAKHASAAGCVKIAVPRTPCDTFCTMLAERGVAMEVIRALAGHIDIRTTQIDVDVTDQRKADGIAVLERARHPWRLNSAHDLVAR